VKGYAQVYTGNCKGKTTAALGLAFRAMGSGFKTYIGQFMKGQQYGELESARMVKPYITIEQYGRKDLIHVQDPPLSEDVQIVSVDSILDLVKTRPDKVEIVLTGRHAPQEVIDAVDLVTEMVEVKHYFTKGVGARKGIEL